MGYNKHFYDWTDRKQWVLLNPEFSLSFASGYLRVSQRNKAHCFPRDHSLSAWCFRDRTLSNFFIQLWFSWCVLENILSDTSGLSFWLWKLHETRTTVKTPSEQRPGTTMTLACEQVHVSVWGPCMMGKSHDSRGFRCSHKCDPARRLPWHQLSCL